MAAFATLGLISIALVPVMLGMRSNDQLVSALGLFVSLAGLTIAVADFLRGQEAPPPDPADQADDLCRIVRAQWLDETRARRLRDPRVLPLSWSATRRAVADRTTVLVPTGGPGARPAARTPRPRQARIVRQRLDGRLDGSFDQAATALATGYRHIPSRRLLLLGEPGSGKSVLALMLTLGLLDDAHREPGGPVPVLLPVSSWDPIVESLDNWMVRKLAESYYAGRPDIPRALLDHGLLLPVLDGLDEIPEAARRGAVRGLNHALGHDRPVVVTCRSAEYEDVVRGGAPTLRHAPVVEIEPVAPADAVQYLEDVTWPEGMDWSSVFDAVRHRPDSPVGEAFSTPLIVSLARTVYERCGGHPAELTDTARFDSRHAVEDYVTYRFVDAAYAPERLPSGEPADPEGREGPNAEQARQWLTFLALYLHRHRERDLVWWLMPQRLLSAWAAPVVGLGLGAALAVFTALGMELLNTGYAVTNSTSSNITSGTLLGAALMLLAMIVWYTASGLPPGRPSFTARGCLPRLRRGFRSGIAFTAIPAGALMAVVALLAAVNGWGRGSAGSLLFVMEFVFPVMFVLGCGLAAHEGFNAPPARATRTPPAKSLRQDRNSALCGALAAGLTVGTGAFPALVTGCVIEDVISSTLKGWRDEPPLLDLFRHHAHRTANFFDVYEDGDYRVAMLIAKCCLLPGAVTAALVLLSRAWTRFLLFRFSVGARHQLPWQLMRFLSDAHQYGVLRQSGGHFQFRHTRLQETLVARGTAAPPSSTAFLGPLLYRAGAAGAVLLLLLAMVSAYPEDRSYARIVTHYDVKILAFDGNLLLTADDRRLRSWHSKDGSRAPSGHRRVRQIELGKELTSPSAPAAVKREIADRAGLTPLGSDTEFDYTDDSGERPDPAALMPWIGDRPRVFCLCTPSPQVWDIGEPWKFTSLHAPREDWDSSDASALSGDLGTLALLSSFERHELTFWNTADGTRLGRRLSEWDGEGVSSLALSNDGSLAAVGLYTGEIDIRRTATGKRVGGFRTGHTDEITNLAFNKSGDTLASSSSDGTVRLWKVNDPG
jgi:hypothetical protein